ncbi:MAG TPA: hypothetical protein DDW54_04215, partial [Clostridiales bacterium]|nr:hypothetical protein [Clostridiales bacterium]
MKKTGFFKKAASALLACLIGTAAFTSCGSDSTSVKFWIYGSSDQLDMYTRLAEEFNRTYGAEHNINVITSQKPNGSYTQTVQVTAGSDNGPDVFVIYDNDMKSWIIGQYMCDISSDVEALTDIDLGDIMEKTYGRLLYDIETNTSNPGDALYGLPLDSQPTALYYNETMFKNAGIIVISVDEEDMDAWNAGEIADKNGQWKRDFPKLNGVKVPKKGFFRNISPYYYNGNKTKAWEKPLESEVLVFNNRIAMNWDEVEDISMIFTGKYNPKAGEEGKSNPVTKYGTEFGYFTEWWFNYGWSVGGDCLNDLTGSGDWNFSLLDPNPNYVVMKGTFTGRTGKVYQVGETIGFLDKMNILTVDGKDEVLVPDDYGDYYHAGTTDLAGIWSGITEEMAKEDPAIAEMPSTREAFQRYLKLGAATTADIDGESGLDISPNPNVVTARGSINYFFSQELAIVAQTSAYMADLSEQARRRGFEWDVAPLAVYKRYADPADPENDTVVAKGKQAGHSNAIAAVVRNGTTKKDKAVAFVKWVASPAGQLVRAKLGFFPNQKSLIGEVEFKKGIAPKNVT